MEIEEGKEVTVNDILDLVVGRIINRMIEAPTDLTIDGLQSWLNGYATCQLDILEIIESMR